MSKNENAKKLNIQIDSNMQTGVYSNASSVRVSSNEVLIDFGYMLPNLETPTMQVVSRVNMSLNAAEKFVTMLQNALLDHRNKTK